MNKKHYSKSFLSNLENDPIKTIKERCNITELEQLLVDASNSYYNTDKLLITDNTYDILIDYLKEIKPKSTILDNIGSEPINIEYKEKLPYYLPSMNKGKPGTRTLNLWLEKYNGPYNISDKLDGLSGLIVFEKDKGVKMYTRGTGTEGTNITKILDYINYGDKALIEKGLDKYNKIVVRGEIIIKESIFEKKYKAKYPKSRSLIAGVVNSIRKVEKLKNILSDIEFKSYELIYPEDKKISDQFLFMKKYGFNTVYNKNYDNIPSLEELYIERKKNSKFNIDGIIITDNSKSYKNPIDGNPKYAIAFKMPLDNQQAETEIEYIEYNISKNGVLKPRIKYKPIIIGGDKLTYATGFNAKYIKDNKLGPGSKIVIIKSGDVIPYIKEIIKSSKSWQEPNVNYKWSDSGVDAIALELNKTTDYLAKVLLHFFSTLGVDGLKLGTIHKLINAGFDSVETILNLNVENLLDIEGFQLKSAEKLINSIKTIILDETHSLEIVMTASNIFTGFGIKKLKLIREYLDNHNMKLNALTHDDIISIDGFNELTAKKILNGLPKFIEWYQVMKTYIKLKKRPHIIKKSEDSKINKFNNEYIVFTGFRNKDLENYIETNGGKIQNTINSKTTLLISKEEVEKNKSSKIKKAQELSIKIMTLDEFKKVYNIDII